MARFFNIFVDRKGAGAHTFSVFLDGCDLEVDIIYIYITVALCTSNDDDDGPVVTAGPPCRAGQHGGRCPGPGMQKLSLAQLIDGGCCS